MDFEKIYSDLESGFEDKLAEALQELFQLQAWRYPKGLKARVERLTTSPSRVVQFWAKRLVKRIEENSPAKTENQNRQEAANPSLRSSPSRVKTSPPPFVGQPVELPLERPALGDEGTPDAEAPAPPSQRFPPVVEPSPPDPTAEATPAPVDAAPGELADPATFERLETPEIQASSVNAITIIKELLAKGDVNDLPRFVDYLQSCSDVVQIAYLAKHLPAAFPKDKLLGVIGPFLRHEDDRVVANAVEGLGFLRSPKTVVLIAQILEHKSHRVRANAGRVLKEFHPALSKEVLSKMLQTRDKPHFSIAACHSAKVLREADYLPNLVGLVGDPLIGNAALDAIIGIGGEDAIEALEPMLEIDVPGFKEKIQDAIQKVRFNTGAEKVRKTVSDTLEAGMKAFGEVAGWFSNGSSPRSSPSPVPPLDVSDRPADGITPGEILEDEASPPAPIGKRRTPSDSGDAIQPDHPTPFKAKSLGPPPPPSFILFFLE